jgi:hypothetical protein
MCKSEETYISGYEDGGGDYGDSITPWYECGSCGMSFVEDEAVVVYIIDDDEPSGNPDLNVISGGYDR